jgi:hypothetical protein
LGVNEKPPLENTLKHSKHCPGFKHFLNKDHQNLGLGDLFYSLKNILKKISMLAVVLATKEVEVGESQF